MRYTILYPVVACIIYAIDYSLAAKDDCEVCVKFLDKFAETLTEQDRKDNEKVQSKLKKMCKKAEGKDERFCFYIGARDDSATYTLNEVTKPLTYFMPSSKICDKLNAKDSQICDLKYEKQADLTEVDFKSLKVKDLKKILSGWGEDCQGCSEKSEFIAKVEKLLPKYDPKAAEARQQKTDL